ncbi:MAG: IS3 family transposase [Bacteroidota bacterium]|nr:IS3 family transposase [Bacteroidota bacterium]
MIKDITVTRPNEVFVSDITYLRLSDGFCYLFLVTDVYSRKIVGYNLSKSLAADGAICALKMALNNLPTVEGLIHHSDRGFQYCSDKYVQLLEPRDAKLSMGKAGNPYENAIAERVNGILKTEFFLNMAFISVQQTMRAVKEAVTLYNDLRPYMSIGYITPSFKYVA